MYFQNIYYNSRNGNISMISFPVPPEFFLLKTKFPKMINLIGNCFFKELNWEQRTVFKRKLNISREKFRIFGGKINNLLGT